MFKANIDKKDDYLILNLAGDLDVYSEEEFRDFIEDELKDKNSDLVIDIKDLDYLDSTGLGMFMKIYKMYEENGQKVKIINPKEDIFEMV